MDWEPVGVLVRRELLEASGSTCSTPQIEAINAHWRAINALSSSLSLSRPFSTVISGLTSDLGTFVDTEIPAKEAISWSSVHKWVSAEIRIHDSKPSHRNLRESPARKGNKQQIHKKGQSKERKEIKTKRVVDILEQEMERNPPISFQNRQ
ncbi:hypothetical protein V6Z12_A01G124100 [Gossypium hirsutum]